MSMNYTRGSQISFAQGTVFLSASNHSTVNFYVSNTTGQFETCTCGTAVAQWLRCCTTNRKVAGLIPDGVIGILHWHNPSDRTMALGSTQALTEMSTRSISWGVKAAGAYGLPYHHPVPLSCNLGTLTSWKPLGHSRPVMGLLYLLVCEMERKIILWILHMCK